MGNNMKRRILLKAQVVLKTVYVECYFLKDIVAQTYIESTAVCDTSDTFKIFLDSTLVGAKIALPKFPPKVHDSGKQWTFSEVAKDLCMSSFMVSRNVNQFFGKILHFKSCNDKELATSGEPSHSWENWDMLQTQLGDELFLYLLQHCAFFVQMQSGCMYQITGLNMFDTSVARKRINVDSIKPHLGLPARKRRKTAQIADDKTNGNEQELQKQHVPASQEKKSADLSVIMPSNIQIIQAVDIENQPLLIPWHKLLYSKNSHIGFPDHHVLEGLKKESDEHLAGVKLLHAIFDGISDPHSIKKIAELHSDSGLCCLLQDFIRNHNGCDYVKMFWSHCSKTSEQPRSKKRRVAKVSSVQHCPTVNVHRFLRAAVHRVIPLELLGSNGNKCKFQHFLGVFLKCDLHDCLSMKHLLGGMAIEDCHWIPNNCDEQARKTWFTKMIKWIFCDYILPCLSGLFYVTEVGGQRNRLFYMDKRAFGTVKSSFLDQMMSQDILLPLPAAEAKKLLVQASSYRQATMRVLPKTFLARPIVHINVTKTEKERLQNEYVKNLLAALQHVAAKWHVTRRTPMGIKDIYTIWKRMAEEFSSLGCPGLYFVKSDILNCFGTMNHTKLREVLLEAFSDIDDITVHRYCAVSSKNGRVVKRFCWCAGPRDSTLFSDISSLKRKHTIVIDLNQPRVLKRQNIVTAVMGCVTKVVMKLGPQNFLMKQGVAQGCPLSPILCNLYYTGMEHEFMKDFFPDQSGTSAEVMIRFMDDYLFVTPNKEKAIRFLDVLVGGIPTFNCTINTDKTLCNFQYESRHQGVRIHCLAENDPIPWFGMLVDPSTLKVCIDYKRYHGQSIASSMSLRASSKEGLLNKVLNLAPVSVEAIYLDKIINGTETVVRSLYHMAVMHAFRIHSLTTKMHPSERPNKHPRFYGKMVLRSVQVMIVSLSLLKSEGLKLPLKPNETRWVLLKGMLAKLQLHKAQYNKVLAMLYGSEKEFRKQVEDEKVVALYKVMGKGLPMVFRHMFD